ELCVPAVVRNTRGARSVGGLLEGVHRVGVLALTVRRIAQVEMEEAGIRLVGEGLVVAPHGVVVLAGRVEARGVTRLAPGVEPADGHGAERDGGGRASHGRASTRRRDGSHPRRAGARRSATSGSRASSARATASGIWNRCSKRFSSVLSSSRFSSVSM